MSYVKLLSFENVAIQVTHDFNETKSYRKSTVKCNTVGVFSCVLMSRCEAHYFHLNKFHSKFPNNDCSLSSSGYHSLINKPRAGGGGGNLHLLTSVGEEN